MTYKYNILLGRIIKVSGYEGAVAVKLEKIFTENIPKMESVFLEIEGRPVPFFIEELEYSGADVLKLWFEGYDSDEKIREFVGCNVFLTSGMPDGPKKDDNQDLIGYKVLIDDDKLLGLITSVLQNNGQLLINVFSINKKNILIPFHEDFIVSIDRKKKIVILKIPDGLTEIN